MPERVSYQNRHEQKPCSDRHGAAHPAAALAFRARAEARHDQFARRRHAFQYQRPEIQALGNDVRQKLLLVFWSITCGTCIEEIPFVIRLHEKLGGRLSVIGVHPPGYPLSKIQKFVRKFPLPIPYMLAIDDSMLLSRAYEVTVLPKMVLLDMRGNVLYSHIGYDTSMEAEIEHAVTSKL